ncbi:MBL fold metallo-hydrolase [Alicyclobacillaceae bacterium I2511]|nr:MBL fold metallo-hydrolase [Alicyclobacillaceae bacterium I2511]
MDLFGAKMEIHPVIIRDRDGVTLVDTGMPGQFSQLRAALEQAGVALTDLRRVILTHQDVDHIGGLPDLLREGPTNLKVWAHAADRPYIEGVKPLLKADPQRTRQMLSHMPPALRAQVESMFVHLPSGRVDVELTDDEVLSVGGGTRVIYTPGHTPGHVSLFVESEKTLITGDAMLIKDGELQGPNPTNTPDMAQAILSLTKLANLPVQTVVCYHGGVYQGNPQARLAYLAAHA